MLLYHSIIYIDFQIHIYYVKYHILYCSIMYIDFQIQFYNHKTKVTEVNINKNCKFMTFEILALFC